MNSATSFSRSGMSDWIVQRVSAVILAAYMVVILGWIALQGDITFANWSAFMGSICMRIFGLLALASLAGHAWVGLWTITTDYLTVRQMGNKATFLRFLAQIGMGVLIFVYVVWGLKIFWGN